MLSRQWKVIAPSNQVRTIAEACLKKYYLRTADALQLASALVWCKQISKSTAACSTNPAPSTMKTRLPEITSDQNHE